MTSTELNSQARDLLDKILEAVSGLDDLRKASSDEQWDEACEQPWLDILTDLEADVESTMSAYAKLIRDAI